MDFDYEHQANWPQAAVRWESPVALQSDLPLQDWQAPRFNPRGLELQLSDKTATIYGDGKVSLDGRDAQFQQVHFHCGGEHVIDGERAAFEAHFVHRYADGETAVVAVPMSVGAANPTFAEILTAIGTEDTAYPISLAPLLPGGDYLHYRGSLTTPPVEAGVAWYVALGRVTLSAEQLNTYRQYFPGDNHRALQDLAGRPVLRMHAK
jgi:carbonic anhydrase